MSASTLTEKNILEKLSAIEARHRVRILYACESGSRCWGFASAFSDYDIRFIYARPIDGYLTITEDRDVIEDASDDVLDVNGWDLKKALQLMLRGNCSLFELLQSPIVYAERPGFRQALLALCEASVTPAKLAAGYRAMAMKNRRAYLSEDPVRLKKYLYVLRPLLAAEWIEKEDSQPPVALDELVGWAAPQHRDMASDLRSLIEKKRAGLLNERGTHMAALDNYIALRLDAPFPLVPPSSADLTAINRFFAHIVRTAEDAPLLSLSADH